MSVDSTTNVDRIPRVLNRLNTRCVIHGRRFRGFARSFVLHTRALLVIVPTLSAEQGDMLRSATVVTREPRPAVPPSAVHFFLRWLSLWRVFRLADHPDLPVLTPFSLLLEKSFHLALELFNEFALPGTPYSMGSSSLLVQLWSLLVCGQPQSNTVRLVNRPRFALTDF